MSSLAFLERIAEEKIREAVERGDFDHYRQMAEKFAGKRKDSE